MINNFAALVGGEKDSTSEVEFDSNRESPSLPNLGQFAIQVDPIRDADNVFGACRFPNVPILSKPENGAALESEVLFGEGFQVLEQQPTGGWTKIRLAANGETGWIDVPFVRMSAEQFAQFSAERKSLVSSKVGEVEDAGGRFLVLMGASIPAVDPLTNTFRIGDHEFHLRADLGALVQPEANRRLLVASATQFYGSSYRWGGRAVVSGADCSGMCVTASRFIGVELPHSANKISTLATSVTLADAKTGDLLFYAKPDASRVSHLGMLIVYKNGCRFLMHDSGTLRLSELDSEGRYDNRRDIVFRGAGRIV